MPEPPTPPAAPPDAATATRASALASAVPYTLVALAGACTVSGGLGFAWLATGHEAPPVALLLAPPAIVLAVVPLLLLRRTPKEPT